MSTSASHQPPTPKSGERPGNKNVGGQPVVSTTSTSQATKPVHGRNALDPSNTTPFDSDQRTSDYLKSLINSKGLKVAWGELHKRLLSCEELVMDLLNRTSHEKLQQKYILRTEYDERVEGQMKEDFTICGQRLSILEDAHEGHKATCSEQRQALEQTYDLHEQQRRSMIDLEVRREQLEEEYKERHKAMTEAWDEEKRRSELGFQAIQVQLLHLEQRLHDQDEFRESISDDVSKLMSVIYSQEQLRQHMNEITADYTPTKELPNLIKEVCCSIVDPLALELQQMNDSVTETRHDVRAWRDQLEDTVKKLTYRIAADERENLRRIAQVMTGIDRCATKGLLQEKEGLLVQRLTKTEESLQSLQAASLNKFQQMADRLTDFQTLVDDHEHALTHQAEEIVGRASKYDLLMCEKKVETCALKDRVEQDMKTLREFTAWQGRIIQQVNGKNYLPSRRLSVAKEGASDETDEAYEDDTGCASLPEHLKGLSMSEILGLFHGQLERLAQGTLGLSHLVFKGICQPAMPREDRQLREAELVHHLSCILHWIRDRKAPLAWDPAKLTTLVMASSVPMDWDRRRTNLKEMNSPSPTPASIRVRSREKDEPCDGNIASTEKAFLVDTPLPCFAINNQAAARQVVASRKSSRSTTPHPEQHSRPASSLASTRPSTTTPRPFRKRCTGMPVAPGVD